MHLFIYAFGDPSEAGRELVYFDFSSSTNNNLQQTLIFIDTCLKRYIYIIELLFNFKFF